MIYISMSYIYQPIGSMLQPCQYFNHIIIGTMRSDLHLGARDDSEEGEDDAHVQPVVHTQNHH